jgi:hypothetical protein
MKGDFLRLQRRAIGTASALAADRHALRAATLSNDQIGERSEESEVAASVELMATTRQARSGSGKVGMNGRKASTAGTLLTRLESTAVNSDRRQTMSRPSVFAVAILSGVSNSFSAPATNTPANRIGSGQSSSR